jgi:general secretion pathway protein N
MPAQSDRMATKGAMRLSFAALLACGFAFGRTAAGEPVPAKLPMLAALENAARPSLDSVEQFPIAPQPAARPLPPEGNPLWSVPLRTLATTRERPIFSPSRRPVVPPAVAAAPVVPAQVARPSEPERPSLALVGTILGEGESMAIFYDTSSKANPMGWKLVAVDPRTTVLEKEQRSVTLALPAPDEAPAGRPIPRRGAGGEPDL